MELTDLRYFVAVADHLHFAKAAATLGITQPPLSRRIQHLEKELGTPLFWRAHKWKVSLTKAGETLLPEARRILRQADFAAHLTHAVGCGETGRLALGAISAMLNKNGFLDSVLEMRRRFPDVRLEVQDSTSANLPELLQNRTLDAVFLRSPAEVFLDDEFHREEICRDELVVALPCHHRLAQAPELPVQALAGESFIMVPERTSPVFRRFLINFLAEKGGFSPEIVSETNQSYTALRLTAAGLGITVVSSAYAGMFPDRLCFRRFSDFVPCLPISAVTAADRQTPALNSFLRILRKRLAVDQLFPPSFAGGPAKSGTDSTDSIVR